MALCLNHIAHGGELDDRERVRSAAGSMFFAGNYSELEKQMEHYRTTAERFQSGLWKLTYFDDGFRTAIRRRGQAPEYWQQLRSRVEEWQKTYPNSAAAHIAYAHVLLEHGRSYRGGGYANTVAADAWKPYFRLVEESRAYLVEHKDVAAQDPRWYELMLTIGYQQQWSLGEFKVVLDEALARHPSFNQIHYAGVTYFLPRWGGNVDAIEAFARHALLRTQDEMGYEMYARIYAFAEQVEFGARLFSDSKVNWQDMSRGIDDLLKRYPSDWNYNFFARFACGAGDREKTKALLEAAGSSIEIGAWGNSAVRERCIKWAGS